MGNLRQLSDHRARVATSGRFIYRLSIVALSASVVINTSCSLSWCSSGFANAIAQPASLFASGALTLPLVQPFQPEPFSPQITYNGLHVETALRHPRKNSIGASEDDMSGIIDRGLQYDQGKLGTSAVSEPFNPSKKNDLRRVSEMSLAEQMHFALIGLATVAEGRGIYSTLAAGQSSRMNPREVGNGLKARVTSLVERIYGGPHQLESKAAVPVGEVGGKVYTFLGLFLKNIARLEEAVGTWAEKLYHPNRVLILTNDAYERELAEELRIQNHYDYHGTILTPHQQLGDQYYATEADVKKLAESTLKKMRDEGRSAEEIQKKEAWFKEALEASRRVREQMAAGHPEAIVMQGEKTALGHGEFYHQLVSSGLLLQFFKEHVRWISVRNIDNSAGTYDWDWLITLGTFIADDLDFQGEVSPRIPGQKGGALIVTQGGMHWLTEDPSFDATWNKTVADFKADGFTIVSPQEAALLAGERFRTQKQLTLDAYPMQISGEKISDAQAALKDIDPRDNKGQASEPNIYLFRNEASGALKWVRRIRSNDTYWFNDAVGIFRPEFLYQIYKKDGQSLNDFIAELDAAQNNPEAREAIADRGRMKFPTLIDPKPARSGAGVATKIETNMWQATAVAGPQARIKAIGVTSVANIAVHQFDGLSHQEKQGVIRELRMLATKQWEGKAESYESNLQFINAIIDYVVHGDLIGHALPPRSSIAMTETSA